MAIQNFVNVFEELNNLGVMDSLLPFLLIFTIVFAVLEKTKIIGEGKKQFNVIIALVISLMVVIPHVTGNYPPGQDAVQTINNALPNVSVVIIAVMVPAYPPSARRYSAAFISTSARSPSFIVPAGLARLAAAILSSLMASTSLKDLTIPGIAIPVALPSIITVELV